MTTDPDVLERCRVDDGRRAKSAIGVRVTEVFFHCPASFQRATLWDQASWRDDAATDFDDFVRAVVAGGRLAGLGPLGADLSFIPARSGGSEGQNEVARVASRACRR